MEELAIGISKTAVQALMDKVETAIKEEAELWQIVQRDTVFMKDEFEMMQSFLKTADWGRIKNNVVRTWVKQVRDLSYDAEDCIESILLLDTKRSLRTLWLRLLASCYCNSGAPLPLDQAVAEIKLLKARVEEVSNRNIRYNLINDSGYKSVTPQQLVSVSAVGPTAIDILKEAWANAKKQGDSIDLTMLVTENNEALRVISVWALGDGLGMTSIIKEAYEDSEICQKFKARAWLKLAHPFNAHEFIRSLADQFYGNSCNKEQGGEIKGIDILTRTEVAKRTDLVKEFVRELNKHRYLVVLEDLTSMAEWHAVRTFLPDSNSGSRIVVSTQQLEIARLCAQPYQILELRELPDSDSICVFFSKAFRCVKEGFADGGSSFTGTANSAPLVGRSSDEDKLSNLISSAGHSDRAHVISVWGFPGIGKSAIVKNVWQRQASNQTSPLFQWYGWVDVSYPFNLRDLCGRILSFAINQRVGEYAGKLPASEPDQKIIDECAEHLRDYRCLVVIDGLQSKAQWNLMKKLILESSKSCIVVVTEEESVAKYCAVQDDRVHGVKALGSEAALKLFIQKFQETATSWDAHMLKEVKYILAKCGGIPEVIVVLAKYLGTPQEDIRQRKLSRLKANFMHELETNPEFVSLRNLIAWMQRQFDALPQSLKACILYLSVFHQANNIRRNRFVRRWIAEGYSRCTDSKTAEDYAGELFKRVATRTATEAEWQANSFFHEYINSQLMEESLVFFPLIVSELSEENYSLITTERLGQHLTISSSWKRDESVFDNLDLSTLQSLTVFGEWRTFFIPYKMRSLRVLDLEGTDSVTDEDLQRILERLPRLRFLSLRGHTEITCLPDSLYDLRLLETLDIRETSVTRLPSRIIKLQKLQYIRAGTDVPWMLNDKELPKPPRCSPLASIFWLSKFFISDAGRLAVEVPIKIGKLTALHTLGAVKVNTASGAAILMELKKLITRLRKLELYGISCKNSETLISVFNSGTHLEDLTLCLEQDNNLIPWDDIRCMRNLRSLKLYGGHVKQLPTDIM